MRAYSKAVPKLTYDELEVALRLKGLQVHIIAIEKELLSTMTYVNLQGELDKTYQVGFYLSDKPKRATLASVWPSSPEENLERLKDAGIAMERGISKCVRCKGDLPCFNL